MASPIPPTWLHHLQDEADAAFLYRALARLEPRSERSRIFADLAAVEDRHVQVWHDLIAAEHGTVPAVQPTLRARVLARLGRWFGPKMLLPLLLSEESREVRSYLALYQASGTAPVGAAALTLAQESKVHASRLSGLAAGEGAKPGAEPWHRTGAGGVLRNVVYGFNDGLTANFGLLAGMIGAQDTISAAGHAVVLAGLAGMVADALSMGSSGYLAAKSEREVFEHEIAMEAEEIRLMPDLEREELALIYEAKGLARGQAQAMAQAIMENPRVALQEKVREELGIGEATSTPMREGWVTGTATAFGAFIPVAPLLLSTAPWAIWTSFGVAMASHFLVGAARSLFTGRGVVRSGMDMFVVGLGVAVLGYYLGEWMVAVL